MPTIGVWVDDETWEMWKILNEYGGKGTKAIKRRIKEIIEENSDWIAWKMANPHGTIEEFIIWKYEMGTKGEIKENTNSYRYGFTTKNPL